MSDEPLPMLPWFPRDFMSATRGWSLEERGLYRELLDAQWEQGALPGDIASLSAIVRVHHRRFIRLWTRVSVKFSLRDDGTIVNLKLEEHRSEALRRIQGKSRAARKAGLASAAARKATAVEQPMNGRSTDVQRAVNHPSPSPSPSPSQSKSQSLFPDISSGIDTLGAAHEKRVRADGGQRIPDPFHLTATMRVWAKSRAPHVDVERATEEFVNFWRGRADKDARKKDWAATWRSRMLQLQQRVGARNVRSTSVDTKYDRMVRELANDDE